MKMVVFTSRLTELYFKSLSVPLQLSVCMRSAHTLKGVEVNIEIHEIHCVYEIHQLHIEIHADFVYTVDFVRYSDIS